MVAKERANVMQKITDSFISMIEKGEANPNGWVRPWHKLGFVSRNALTGKAYRGINQTAFSAYAMMADTEPIWATYKQWTQLGCQVQKGETSSFGVKWVELDKDKGEKPKVGEKGRPSVIPVAFLVFHVGQVEDAEGREGAKQKVLDRFKPVELTAHARHEAAELAENTLRAAGAKIGKGGDRAAYSPSRDAIMMPTKEQFHTLADFVSTLAHEHIHWTGHASRLNREGITESDRGGPKYAFEELVAELGAAGLCQELNVEDSPRVDHAHYLANWLVVLKNDKNALQRACSQADKARQFVLDAAGFTGSLDAEPAPEATVEEPVAPVKRTRTRRAKEVVTV